MGGGTIPIGGSLHRDNCLERYCDFLFRIENLRTVPRHESRGKKTFREPWEEKNELFDGLRMIIEEVESRTPCIGWIEAEERHARQQTRAQIQE